MAIHVAVTGARTDPEVGVSPDVGELVASLLSGGDAAFAALYLRYCDRAHRVGRIGSVNRARAEDAVQDAFAAIWNTRARYRARRLTASTSLPPEALTRPGVKPAHHSPHRYRPDRSGSRSVKV
ncbi:MAG TPA: hypothetical protein VIJ51_01515 [Solirubrobacteraceae bacterium]